jgi:hypothetical protein
VYQCIYPQDRIPIAIEMQCISTNYHYLRVCALIEKSNLKLPYDRRSVTTKDSHNPIRFTKAKIQKKKTYRCAFFPPQNNTEENKTKAARQHQ